MAPSLDVVALVWAYLAGTAALLAVLLFGDAPCAAGTPLPWLRWLVAEAWADALEWLVARVAGRRGLQALDGCVVACCERQNPALQVAYLALWSAGYALYQRSVFALLPGPFAGAWHVHAGTSAVCATLAAFLLASAARPGSVDAGNVQAYLAAYPPDGSLFARGRRCPTCELPRPGRSKHCGLCGACVPRFDHHCGWINACVGLHNTRAFLAFLAANLATCCYGCALAVAAIAGDLARRGMFDVYVYDAARRARVPLAASPARAFELALALQPVAAALAAFLAAATALLAAFLGYHCALVSQGRTAYETFKRAQLLRRRRAAAEAEAAAGVAAADVGGGFPDAGTAHRGGGGGGGWLGWLLWWRRRRRPQQQCDGGSSGAACRQQDAGRWPYDRGSVAANWSEVLWPESFLAESSARVAQSAEGTAAAAAAAAADGSHATTTANGGGPAAALPRRRLTARRLLGQEDEDDDA